MIRIVCLILILLVACDLAWNGAYAKIAAALTNHDAPDHIQQLVLGGLFAGVAFAAIVAGLVLVGFHHRSVVFLIDVEKEMKAVEWPAMNALAYATLVIAITMAVVGGLIFGVDAVIHKVLFKYIFAEGG